MDKRKGIIATVLLLLLIGTGSFVFANQSDSLEEGENSGVWQPVNTGNGGTATPTPSTTPRPSATPTQEITPTPTELPTPSASPRTGNTTRRPNGTTGNGNTQTNGATNNAQGAATAGNNESGERTPTPSTTPVPSQDLASVTSLVEKLDYLVKNATNKNDIQEALKLREDEHLQEKINNLTDEQKKQELLNMLEETSKIMDDKTAPSITGITGPRMNQTSSIEITDQNDVIILLNNVETTRSALKQLNTEGEYELIVRDSAYNETKVSFTLDTTPPSANIVYSNQGPTNQDVTVEITPSEAVNILNNGGKTTYTFTENGTFEFIMEDLAGNTQTIQVTVDNIDKVAPVYEDLGILDATALEKNENTSIASKGDVITAFVTFKEKLAGNPKILFNETSELEATLVKEDAGNYTYAASYTVAEDTKEGTVTIKVSGYQDSIGNVGAVLTNAEIKNPTYKSVDIILEPGFEFIPDTSFSDKHMIIKEPEFDHMEVCPKSSKKCILVNEKEYDVPRVGTYTFKLYDKDNNLLKEVKMTYDNVAPKITAVSETGSKVTDKNTLYDSVTVTISDNKLALIKRVYEDGREVILKEYEPNDYSDFKATFVTGGAYKIVAADKAGNESEIEFSVTEKEGSIPVALSALTTAITE